jgi:hypothetical protein
MRAALLLLALVACRGSDAAPLVPVPDAPPAAIDTTAKRRTLELRIAGAPLGGGTFERVALPDGGVRLRSQVTLSLRLDNPGEPARTSEHEDVEEYGPDLRLRHARSVARENDVEERTEVTVAPDGVTVRAVAPAHEDERFFPIPPDLGNGFAAFEEMRAEALAGAALPLERRWAEIDAEQMMVSHQVLRLLERTTVSLPDGEVPVWRLEQLDVEDSSRTELWLDDDQLPLRLEMGVLEAAAPGLLEERPPGRISSYLKVDGRLDEAHPDRLRVHLLVDGADPSDPDAVLDSPYQEVTRTADGYQLVLAPRRATPGVVAPTRPVAPPPEFAGYLAPTPASQSDDPAIVALAREIAGDRRDSREVAAAITREVFFMLDKRDGVRGSATAVETLDARRGDCTEHAALTVALHRAAGIPARIASGMVIAELGGKTEAAYHAWTEVWLGEWVVMDAALGDLEVGANYIWFAYDEPGDPSGANSMSQLLGRTRVVLP